MYWQVLECLVGVDKNSNSNISSSNTSIVNSYIAKRKRLTRYALVTIIAIRKRAALVILRRKSIVST